MLRHRLGITQRYLAVLLLALHVIFFPENAYSEPLDDVLIVTTDEGKLSDSIAKQLQMSLPASRQVSLDELDSIELNTFSSIISLGSNACDQLLLAGVNVEVICALIRQSYVPGILGQNNFKFLPMEVPLPYFIKLARALGDEVKRVGIVSGPNLQVMKPFVERMLDRQHLQINWVSISDDDNPVKALTGVIQASDIFIVLPDSAGFNRALAPWILQLSLHQRTPVLAYSFSYANAGALASLYQSDEDILRNILELYEHKNSSLHFSLRLNFTVGRNLGFDLQSEDDYLQKIYQDGGL